MALPQQIIENRTKLQFRRDRLKNLLDFKSFDIDKLTNAIPKNLQAQGQALLPSLILTQGGKLLKSVVPSLNDLLKKFGVENIENLDLNDIESLKQEFCPTTESLDSIVLQRNNIVDYINNIGAQLDALSITVDFGSDFASLLQGIITNIKRGQSLANLAMSFIPVALPGAVPATINTLGNLADRLTFKPDGTPILPPITITASQVSPAVSTVQNIILKVIIELEKIDLLINICNPNYQLTSPSDSITQSAQTDLAALGSENEVTYKGFILEIETRPFSDTVDQNRAVGKNNNGIILVATNYSFASDPNVLIEELKFTIDRDDLKAY